MNLIDLLESPQLCPECGGPAFADLLLAEKKDACYHKVRSRYKVWPSAYASGALVQCRKKGAANWGNKNESQEPGLSSINDDDWYEIDDQGKIYKQSGPSSYRPTFGTREIKLNNGHRVVRGMTLKAMRLKQGKDQGVAEGSTDTVYPNATVIKSKNGRPVGEIYQDGNSWGAFHYRADRGYDFLDSKEDAIQALKDLHQETGRGGPDYTFKGVAEGLNQPREAAKAIQSLQNLALMKSASTMTQLMQAGRESIVTNALAAAAQLEQNYKKNNQLGNAIFVRALRDEIDNFKKGYPINASFPESDNASELGDLLKGKLGKVNFQQGVAEGSLYEGVNDPHIFKCIFLFGPMGAGKSTVAGPLLSHTGLRSVNLDNFNEMFIKKGQVPTGHLAPEQLEKSWQLSQIQQQNFVDGRLGIIIDGSGRNPETALSVIKKLKPLGYEFMMIFVNVSEATSIARQQSRANKQQQQWGVGRQVDTTTAKNTYAQVQQNLSQYKEYFGSQRFVYVDNENTPDLTQATKKIDTFLRAPVTQPAALAWIQAQKGGQQVAQQQQKLATAKDRQQQALTQYQQGVAEGKMAELEMDLEDPEITDRQFEKMYGMTRKEAREQFSQTDMWAFPEIRDPNRPLHERGVAEEFGPLPKDNQQIRLGRHTVDIERVGLDKNYISFAWQDSKGQEHYEEVAVGDLGSYDDLIDRIKQEISHQERKYTDQGVAEGPNEKIGGRHDPDDFDDMVRRLKKLAGAGPMQTQWDPKKRVYRNMPTAVQPPKHNKGSQ